MRERERERGDVMKSNAANNNKGRKSIMSEHFCPNMGDQFL